MDSPDGYPQAIAGQDFLNARIAEYGNISAKANEGRLISYSSALSDRCVCPADWQTHAAIASPIACVEMTRSPGVAMSAVRIPEPSALSTACSIEAASRSKLNE